MLEDEDANRAFGEPVAIPGESRIDPCAGVPSPVLFVGAGRSSCHADFTALESDLGNGVRFQVVDPGRGGSLTETGANKSEVVIDRDAKQRGAPLLARLCSDGCRLNRRYTGKPLSNRSVSVGHLDDRSIHGRNQVITKPAANLRTDQRHDHTVEPVPLRKLV